MSENKLVASARDSFGKGAARKLRAAGQTPVVVYGHGTEPQHLTVESHPLSLILRQANALIELEVAGKPQLVLVKAVQKNPVLQVIEHVDLIVVKKGEKVEVEVPLHVVGSSFSGTSSLQELNTIRLLVPATNIRRSVEVSIEGLTAGTQVLAGDVQLDGDEELLDAPDALVVQILAPRGGADEEEAPAAE